MSRSEAIKKKAGTGQAGASDKTHVVLTFENNRLASELFGQFDQNLALIEQKLPQRATKADGAPTS